MNSKAEFDPKTYAIIGAAMEVHRQLRWGFAEPVYQECMEIELRERSIPFLAQERVHLRYKGRLLKSSYRPDFLCFDSVIVELKVIEQIGPVEAGQVINYLKVTGYPVGLVLNFGGQSLEKRRFICTND
jgi:GxxExxY protein